MTNGVDPAFEATEQIFDVFADSKVLAAAQTVELPIGIVPSGQNWLVERIALQYRPGIDPTDTYVPFRLNANGRAPADLRDATQLAPNGGWQVAAGIINYYFIADEASPIRFFAGEQVVAIVKVYGADSRVAVTIQVRAVSQIRGGSNVGDTSPVEPVTPAEAGPDPREGWN